MAKQRFGFLCICLVAFFCNALAQDILLTRPVSINVQAVSVRAFVDSLGVVLGAEVAYDADALPLDSFVSVNWENVNVKEGLYQLFGPDRIEVSSLPGQIIVSRADYTLEKTTRPLSVVLSGTVREAVTNEPLPAATISFFDMPMGTITNNNGEFAFLVPADFVGKKLVVSMIGYAPAHLWVPSADSVCSITMTATQVNLPEVRVLPISADLVMAKVMERRHDNYLQSSVALTGFFRETVQQDDRYVQASEAIIEVYKPPYADSYKLEKVRFVKGRRNANVEKVSSVQLKLQGGPYYFSRLDIMRYLDFLPEKQSVPMYRYKYAGPEWANGKSMIRIAFEPIADDGELLYKGEFLVDAESYAVASVQFEMTDKTLRESRKYLIKKESRQYKASPYFARYYIDYRLYRDKWILNSVRGEVKIRVKDKQNRVDADFFATTEMLISDLRPIDGERLRYAETFKADYILADKIGGDDPDFWRDFNIIKPDEKLANVFKKAIGETP